MGCDIHAHIEIKINGKWEHYSCPPIQRCYYLFERICGVRGDVENAIAPPRGLPNDLNIVTQTCYDLEDHHTPTWLTARELDGLINWMEEKHNPMFQCDEIGYLNGCMFSNTYSDWEDVRFICWFDN